MVTYHKVYLLNIDHTDMEYETEYMSEKSSWIVQLRGSLCPLSFLARNIIKAQHIMHKRGIYIYICTYTYMIFVKSIWVLPLSE